MKKNILIFGVLFFFIPLSACTEASDINAMLNKAKKEGKVVMLELGSVGCIPCEQMKPVMERLKNNYKERLEVIFIDVRVDRRSAQRFRVFMIPTQVFLDKNGMEFHRHIGYYSYEEIVLVLKQVGL